mmetsp:Transcript_9991/g.24689  ORF Transcript_9991/g.24689 Transcript_9991/m.24689 type:complete len:325 (+) Transcript_9991:858-1832(+)
MGRGLTHQSEGADHRTARHALPARVFLFRRGVSGELPVFTAQGAVQNRGRARAVQPKPVRGGQGLSQHPWHLAGSRVDKYLQPAFGADHDSVPDVEPPDHERAGAREPDRQEGRRGVQQDSHLRDRERRGASDDAEPAKGVRDLQARDGRAVPKKLSGLRGGVAGVRARAGEVVEGAPMDVQREVRPQDGADAAGQDSERTEQKDRAGRKAGERVRRRGAEQQRKRGQRRKGDLIKRSSRRRREKSIERREQGRRRRRRSGLEKEREGGRSSGNRNEETARNDEKSSNQRQSGCRGTANEKGEEGGMRRRFSRSPARSEQAKIN